MKADTNLPIDTDANGYPTHPRWIRLRANTAEYPADHWHIVRQVQPAYFEKALNKQLPAKVIIYPPLGPASHVFPS